MLMADALTCAITTNPDISGIGIRVSIYASTVIGYAMTALYPEDLDSFRDSARTSMLASAALIILGFYKLATTGLTLVDAQIITMLVMAGTAYCAGAVPELNLGVTAKAVCFCYTVLSGVFGIVVYAHVDTFGGALYSPECQTNENTIFVIFGQSISATNLGLRIFALISFSLALLEVLRRSRAPVAIFVLRLWTGNFEPNPPPARKPHMRPVLPVGIAVIIYAIVTTEQIIARNGLQGASNQWTFGQMLCIALLIDQVLRSCSRIKQNERDKATLRQLDLS